jgi:electron transfer flavoprotein alpha/beta subunit
LENDLAAFAYGKDRGIHLRLFGNLNTLATAKIYAKKGTAHLLE